MECALMLRLARRDHCLERDQPDILVRVRRELARLWWDGELRALSQCWERILPPAVFTLPFAQLFPSVCGNVYLAGFYMSKRGSSLSTAYAQFQPEVAESIEEVAASGTTF